MTNENTDRQTQTDRHQRKNHQPPFKENVSSPYPTFGGLKNIGHPQGGSEICPITTIQNVPFNERTVLLSLNAPPFYRI